MDTDSTESIAWGDFNGDGLLDLVAGNNGAKRVYKNTGSGTFTSVWTSADTDATRSIAWGDFNGDGLLDLAAGNYQQAKRVYQGSNLPVNTAPTAPSSGFSSTFNSSGKLALRWGNGYDVETSTFADLTYALRVSTQSTGTEVVPPYVVPDERIGSPLMGNFLTYHSTSTNDNGVSLSSFTQLQSNNTYYWQTRTIDTGLMTSTWTAVQSLYVQVTPANVQITTVSVSSFTVTWSTPAYSTGYEVDASTASDFTGVVMSTITSVGALTSLVVDSMTSLSPNTTYFIQVGNIANGTTSYASPALSTSTLASPLNNILLYQVNQTSITVNWTAWVSTGPGANTSQGYELDVSTMSSFIPLWDSSTTAGVSLSTLTVGVVNPLSPYTTYYLRVGGSNFNNVVNYTILSPTQTLAGQRPRDPVLYGRLPQHDHRHVQHSLHRQQPGLRAGCLDLEHLAGHDLFHGDGESFLKYPDRFQRHELIAQHDVLRAHRRALFRNHELQHDLPVDEHAGESGGESIDLSGGDGECHHKLDGDERRDGDEHLRRL